MPSLLLRKNNRRAKIVTFLIICKKKNAQNIDFCCLGKRFCCLDKYQQERTMFFLRHFEGEQPSLAVNVWVK